MKKCNLRIKLKPGIDSVRVAKFLNWYYARQVKAGVEDETTIVVWFSESVISAKMVLKLVNRATSEEGKSKTPNVASVIELSETDEEAA